MFTGAKLIEVTPSSILYHRADVIYSWFYLTGKLQELKENAKNNQNKNLITPNQNGNNENNGKKLDENEAEKMLDIFVKNSGKTEIEENKLVDLFKKFGGKKNDIINNLVNNNKLIDNNGIYEIM